MASKRASRTVSKNKTAVNASTKATTNAPAKTTAKVADVKKPETKAAEKSVEKKEPEVKPVETKAVEKSTVKAAKAQEIYLQFAGREVTDKELLEKVKEIWTKDLGNKVKDMIDVKIYVKPEECAAYYVINGDVTGNFDL